MGFNIRTIFDLDYDNEIDNSIYLEPDKEFICENHYGLDVLIEKFFK